MCKFTKNELNLLKESVERSMRHVCADSPLSLAQQMHPWQMILLKVARGIGSKEEAEVLESMPKTVVVDERFRDSLARCFYEVVEALQKVSEVFEVVNNITDRSYSYSNPARNAIGYMEQFRFEFEHLWNSQNP